MWHSEAPKWHSSVGVIARGKETDHCIWPFHKSKQEALLDKDMLWCSQLPNLIDMMCWFCTLGPWLLSCCFCMSRCAVVIVVGSLLGFGWSICLIWWHDDTSWPPNLAWLAVWKLSKDNFAIQMLIDFDKVVDSKIGDDLKEDEEQHWRPRTNCSILEIPDDVFNDEDRAMSLFGGRGHERLRKGETHYCTLLDPNNCFLIAGYLSIPWCEKF